MELRAASSSSSSADAPQQLAGDRTHECRMDEYLRSRGFYRKKIAKDGSCLFRAVAEQVLHCQGLHTEVRAACVKYLKQHRSTYELFIEGNFEKYLDNLRDPQSWVGQVEISALAELYKHDFIIFQEPDQPPVNITENGFANKVRLCFLNGNHYDSVYPESFEKNAAVCQSILYEVLYDRVCGVERSIIGPSMKGGRGRDRLDSEECKSSEESDLEEGDFWSTEPREKTSNGMNPRPPQRGRGRGYLRGRGRDFLSTKVQKSLNPGLYRNVEYDVWLRSKRLQQQRDFCIAAGMQYSVGDKCKVQLSGSNRLYNAYVKEVSPDNGPVTVFIEELNRQQTVPLLNLRLPSEEPQSWQTVSEKGNRQATPNNEWENRGSRRSNKTQPQSTTNSRVHKQHSWPPQATPEDTRNKIRRSDQRSSPVCVLPAEEEGSVVLDLLHKDERNFPSLGTSPQTGTPGELTKKGGEKKGSRKKEQKENVSETETSQKPIQRQKSRTEEKHGIKVSEEPDQRPSITVKEEPIPISSSPTPPVIFLSGPKTATSSIATNYSAPGAIKKTPIQPKTSPAQISDNSQSVSVSSSVPLQSISGATAVSVTTPSLQFISGVSIVSETTSAPRTTSGLTGASVITPVITGVSVITPAPQAISGLTGASVITPAPQPISGVTVTTPALQSISGVTAVSVSTPSPIQSAPTPQPTKVLLPTQASLVEPQITPVATTAQTSLVPSSSIPAIPVEPTLSFKTAPLATISVPALDTPDWSSNTLSIDGSNGPPVHQKTVVPQTAMMPVPPPHAPLASISPFTDHAQGSPPDLPQVSVSRPCETSATPTSEVEPVPDHPSKPQQFPFPQLQWSRLLQDPVYPGFPQNEKGELAPTPAFCHSQKGEDLPKDTSILRFFFNLGVKAYTQPMFPPIVYLAPLNQAYQMHIGGPLPSSDSPANPPMTSWQPENPSQPQNLSSIPDTSLDSQAPIAAGSTPVDPIDPPSEPMHVPQRPPMPWSTASFSNAYPGVYPATPPVQFSAPPYPPPGNQMYPPSPVRYQRMPFPQMPLESINHGPHGQMDALQFARPTVDRGQENGQMSMNPQFRFPGGQPHLSCGDFKPVDIPVSLATMEPAPYGGPCPVVPPFQIGPDMSGLMPLPNGNQARAFPTSLHSEDASRLMQTYSPNDKWPEEMETPTVDLRVAQSFYSQTYRGGGRRGQEDRGGFRGRSQRGWKDYSGRGRQDDQSYKHYGRRGAGRGVGIQLPYP